MANVNFHGYSSGGSGAVDSINGKTGTVTLYGSDITVSTSDSNTIDTELTTIKGDVSDINAILSGLATVATTGDYDDLLDKPVLSAVATSGSYNDLSNKPSLSNVAISGSYTDLINKPNLATVATSGSYTDLTNRPTIPDDLNDLADVTLSSPQNGQVLKYDISSNKWVNANESGGGGGATIDDTTISTLSCWSSSKTNTEISNHHKVTNKEVTTTSWTQDTTSQSGTTLYKKQITLNNIYTTPEVEIGAGTGYVLPTTSEQESYDLIQYTTYDDTVPCLYLYASDIPQTAFYINVGGVD